VSAAADRSEDLALIARALAAAAEVLLRYEPQELSYEMKGGHSPVTAADHEVDALLRDMLPRPGDGWLSEETADSEHRLQCRRVWIVDPLDGTRDFLARRPEYSTSIALCEDGVPVLGGVCNPAAAVTVLGGTGLGVQVQGTPALSWPTAPARAFKVLGSRSEWQRGEWRRFEGAGLSLLPMGSVAYKLALVAAGAADATWTLKPKSEWDVAAGVALVCSAGGEVWRPDGGVVTFNGPRPRFPCFAAASASSAAAMRRLVGKSGPP
jgi:myo-inositol-1(or 4)-monophosphatase